MFLIGTLACGITACGNKGRLKTPQQIQVEQAKKARQQAKQEKEEQDDSDEATPASTPTPTAVPDAK